MTSRIVFLSDDDKLLFEETADIIEHAIWLGLYLENVVSRYVKCND